MFPYCCPFFWVGVAHATRMAAHTMPITGSMWRSAALGRYAYQDAVLGSPNSERRQRFDFWYGQGKPADDADAELLALLHRAFGG